MMHFLKIVKFILLILSITFFLLWAGPRVALHFVLNEDRSSNSRAELSSHPFFKVGIKIKPGGPDIGFSFQSGFFDGKDSRGRLYRRAMEKFRTSADCTDGQEKNVINLDTHNIYGREQFEVCMVLILNQTDDLIAFSRNLKRQNFEVIVKELRSQPKVDPKVVTKEIVVMSPKISKFNGLSCLLNLSACLFSRSERVQINLNDLNQTIFVKTEIRYL